jgi:glutamate/tyrosine decarboxylase-like PLP-dependent enzyme
MFPDRSEFEAALKSAHDKAADFLSGVDLRPPGVIVEPPPSVGLSEDGAGSIGALDELWIRYGDLFSGSSGPRYWGFIQGGLTPAALAGDWLCSAIDQTGQMHGDSPSVFIERDAIAMLRELFGLPEAYSGNFVSGGTMANAVGLAIGLQALGSARGVNVSEQGIGALGPVKIVSGEAHASIGQAAAMLGLGRSCVERLPLLDRRERVSSDAMRARLRELEGASLIVVGNAGTVNTGDIDDLEALADLAEEHDAHFHVDGAFGLFAAAAPSHAHLMKGIDRAGTIASDAHKWLNVPYGSGFVFTRHVHHQIAMFQSPSAYLPPTSVDLLAFQNMSPENSRRLRALPAWIALRAYGRSGYRELVERGCALAELFGQGIGTEPGFRLLAPVRLNVVCFQLLDEAAPADGERTREFVERIKQDGRLVVSRSVLWGEPCIRAALLNWRTSEADIDIAMTALREVREAMSSKGDSR